MAVESLCRKKLVFCCRESSDRRKLLSRDAKKDFIGAACNGELESAAQKKL